MPFKTNEALLSYRPTLAYFYLNYNVTFVLDVEGYFR